jgi:hypothetical protein
MQIVKQRYSAEGLPLLRCTNTHPMRSPNQVPQAQVVLLRSVSLADEVFRQAPVAAFVLVRPACRHAGVPAQGLQGNKNSCIAKGVHPTLDTCLL